MYIRDDKEDIKIEDEEEKGRKMRRIMRKIMRRLRRRMRRRMRSIIPPFAKVHEAGICSGQ